MLIKELQVEQKCQKNKNASEERKQESVKNVNIQGNAE